MICYSNHKKNVVRLYLLCLMAASTFAVHSQKTGFLTGYVNPFIGTAGHGHTFPGASVPVSYTHLTLPTTERV